MGCCLKSKKETRLKKRGYWVNRYFVADSKYETTLMTIFDGFIPNTVPIFRPTTNVKGEAVFGMVLQIHQLVNSSNQLAVGLVRCIVTLA